jgi:hypothetical protein
MNFLMKMGNLFRPPTKIKGEELIHRGEKKMKILTIRGSPRPKVSNIEILLRNS